MKEENFKMTPKVYPLLICISCLAILNSCSKKIQPAKTSEQTVTVTDTAVVKIDTIQVEVKKIDSVVIKKEPVKRKPKPTIPKVIVVNDKVARKSVDGRLYYDLQGHRYWRSNKDGKYYLYNKSMNTDDAFKKPN